MDKQPLVDNNAGASAPPPYTPPSGGYGGTAPGYPQPHAQPSAPTGYQQPYSQQQNTTVIVTGQPRTVATVYHIKPPNYTVLSVLNMLFCCFLFGLIALIMGIQSDSAWTRGDREEAHRLSMAARRWNIAGIAGGVIFTAAWVVTVIAVNVSINSYY